MDVNDVVFLTSLMQDEIEGIRLADGDSTLTEADNGLVLRAERLVAISIAFQQAAPLQVDVGEELTSAVTEIYTSLCERFDQDRRPRGRPPIPISEDQLVLLLDCQFSVVKISQLLQCSARTIRRKIDLYDLGEYKNFSDVGDDDLNTLATTFAESFPNGGYKSFQGYLHSQGIRVQRSRVRHSLAAADPHGVQRRLRRSLHRREYQVCMPQSLWHIDGCHKLIRWRIIIHGEALMASPDFVCTLKLQRITVLAQF